MTATTSSGGVISTAEPVDAGCTTNNSTRPRRACYDPRVLVMQLTRLVVIGAAGGALVVWAAAAATSSSTSRPVVSAAQPAVSNARGAQLQSEIARLHERLRPDAAPVQRRDLFHYGSNARSMARSAAPAAVVPLTPEPAVAVAPPLKLIGLAEDPGNDGVVRTAIISGHDDLFMVKEGERVADHYRVVTISGNEVVLSDDRADAPLHLRLP